MISTNFEWHPHTEAPVGDCVALLLAAPADGDGDETVLLGMFDWVHGKLINTGYGLDAPGRRYFWAYELDVVGSLSGVI